MKQTRYKMILRQLHPSLLFHVVILFFLTGCATKYVQGQILDAQGKPLPDATVILADKVVHTNQEGMYEIDRLALKEGQYVIFVTHEEHIFIQTSQRIAGSKVVLSPIKLEAIQVEIPYPEIPLETMIGD